MYDPMLALTCARLSQEIYQQFDELHKFVSVPGSVTLIESQDQGQTDTQAALVHQPDINALYLIFRGTEKGIDWITNFQLRQQVYPYAEAATTDVRFHQGFMAAYFAVRDRLQDQVRQYPTCTLTVTGHSLGGALATVAALDLQYNITQHTQQPLQVYTFGAPRVGNAALVNSFRQRVPQSYRFVYGWDIVTHLPRIWQGYSHVPQEYRLGERWTWKVISRRFSDHNIHHYIEALTLLAQAAPEKTA